MDLKFIRKLKKISQINIAQQLDIQQATYSHYEKGKRQPSIELLPELAKVLNCTIEQVVYALIQTKQNTTSIKKSATGK